MAWKVHGCDPQVQLVHRILPFKFHSWIWVKTDEFINEKVAEVLILKLGVQKYMRSEKAEIKWVLGDKIL